MNKVDTVCRNSVVICEYFMRSLFSFTSICTEPAPEHQGPCCIFSNYVATFPVVCGRISMSSCVSVRSIFYFLSKYKKGPFE